MTHFFDCLDDKDIQPSSSGGRIRVIEREYIYENVEDFRRCHPGRNTSVSIPSIQISELKEDDEEEEPLWITELKKQDKKSKKKNILEDLDKALENAKSRRKCISTTRKEPFETTYGGDSFNETLNKSLVDENKNFHGFLNRNLPPEPPQKKKIKKSVLDF